MAGKEIKIMVPLIGISKGKRQVTFEADGFKGSGCQAATKVFSDALGATGEEELKAEFYEAETEHERLTEGGGDGLQSS